MAAKRITGPQPNTPVPFAALDFSNDPDAKAVIGIPGTPDEDEAVLMAPSKVPRQSLPPPAQAVVASEAGQLSESVDVTMDDRTQMAVPSTPVDHGGEASSTPVASALGPEVSVPSSSAHTHDDIDSDRPTKVPRILAVQGVDHEDEEPIVYFESQELELLEAYEYDLQDDIHC